MPWFLSLLSSWQKKNLHCQFITIPTHGGLYGEHLTFKKTDLYPHHLNPWHIAFTWLWTSWCASHTSCLDQHHLRLTILLPLSGKPVRHLQNSAWQPPHGALVRCLMAQNTPSCYAPSGPSFCLICRMTYAHCHFRAFSRTGSARAAFSACRAAEASPPASRCARHPRLRTPHPSLPSCG